MSIVSTRTWFFRSAVTLALVVLFAAAWAITTVVHAQTTTHIVQPADTAMSIAAEYDVSVNALLAANDLTDASEVEAGQILIIPEEEPSAVATATPLGSSLGGINQNNLVLEALPTNPPIPVTPTPFDPANAITLSQPRGYFVTGFEAVPVIGTVVLKPGVTSFWKLEILGGSTQDRIRIGDQSLPANQDWITLNSGTSSVINGELGVVPGFPTLNEGYWKLRVVVTSPDAEFLDTREFTFRILVTPDENSTLGTFLQPSNGQQLTPSAFITGTVVDQDLIGGYRVELQGGPYTDWTPLSQPQVEDSDDEDEATPPNALAVLPPDLPTGPYQVRLVVTASNGVALGDPIVRGFTIGVQTSPQFPRITINRPAQLEQGQLTITSDVTVTGTVKLPFDAGYFKVDIKDAAVLADGQEPRFTDWTTMESIRQESVTDGYLVMLPGPPGLAPGRYDLRIVIVRPDGTFANIREYNLRVAEAASAD